ncbi:MAG: hypothetical protein GY707_14410, partial [Desulfobacteraceae bacterium]|nr:hypothetical protein [Desulfobacteraceae bacterium]
QKTKPTFSAAIAKKMLKNGWYAVIAGSAFEVSMGWIDLAAQNERNVFPNLAHEIGGHVYYGKTVSGEVSDQFFKDNKDYDKLFRGTPKDSQEHYMNYVYPETEVFAELVEKRFKEKDSSGYTPKGGGDSPTKNIPEELNKMKQNLHPEITKKACDRLVAMARKHPSIRDEDLKYLLSQIETILGYKYPDALKARGNQYLVVGRYTGAHEASPLKDKTITASDNVLVS